MGTKTKEEAFAEVIRDYENLWVALLEKDGEEFAVGSGTTPKEAIAEAQAKGYNSTVLFSVPSFSRSFVY